MTNGPIAGRNISSDLWRGLFGGLHKGIVNDKLGSAFGLTLNPTTNTVTVTAGPDDAAQAHVAGHHYEIAAAGSSAPLATSTPSGGARVDTVLLRYDPTWEDKVAYPDGPVRLLLIEGTPGAGAPTFDLSSPGAEDLLLYQFTRPNGASLSGVAPVDLRAWTGTNLELSNAWTADRLNTLNAPIGTTASIPYSTGRVDFRRVTVGGVAQWLPVRPSITQTFRRTREDGVGSGSFGVAVGGVLSGAPAGNYLITASTTYRTTVDATCYYRVMANTTNMSLDIVVPGKTGEFHMATWTGVYPHIGGDLTLSSAIRADFSDLYQRPASTLTAVYLGRA